MKKILFIDTGHEYGGGTKSFLYLLQFLDKSRYAPYVFFEKDYYCSDQKISQVIKKYDGIFLETTSVKKEICKLKKELLRVFYKKKLIEQEFQIKTQFALEVLQEFQRKFQIDLIHLNNHFGTNLEYIIVANKLQIPVIQHLRKNSLLSSYQKDLLKNLQYETISVSNSTKNFYSKQVKVSNYVVYNPFPIVTQDNKQNSISSSDIKIAMPANYLENKGHKLVFEALLKTNRNDIKLYLAGSGSMDKHTEELKERLKQEGKVVELGFVTNMEELYKNVEYVLSFSENEGLPRSVIEGLCFGCGIISSNYDVSREIYDLVDNQDYYFIIDRKVDDLVDLFLNLNHLQGRPSYQNVMKTFSLDNYINGIEKIYQQCLK